MPSRSHKGLTLYLFLLFACNPGGKLNQTVGHGEASPRSENATDAADSAERLDSQTLDMPAAEKPVETVATDPMPKDEAAPIEEDEKNPVASEPVPIGGAYLTCNYRSGQNQGQDDYLMDCAVTPANLNLIVAQAAFFKLDPAGNTTPLTIVDQDLLALRWTVREKAATLPHNRVQLLLTALNTLTVSLTTTVTTPLTLNRVADYWLGGEPNNTVLNGEDEDCVEFSNAAMKLQHQNTSGIVTGALGRMNDIACSSRYNFLCRNVSAGADAAKWQISAFTGTFAESARACAQGYAFGFPVSAEDVREVSAIVDRNNQPINIWVNMSDRARENVFSVIYR